MLEIKQFNMQHLTKLRILREVCLCLSDDIPYPIESPLACSFSPVVSASPLGGGGAVDFKDVMTRLQTEALWRGGVETLRKNPGAITNQAFMDI